MNTSIKQKKELWPTFLAACESQLMGGGDRYKLSKDKEFTDLVCEVASNKWIGGNIVKYVGEIINNEPKPEVNFFKIAVYAFLWWIKEQDNLTGRDKGEEFSKVTGQAREQVSLYVGDPTTDTIKSLKMTNTMEEFVNRNKTYTIDSRGRRIEVID